MVSDTPEATELRFGKLLNRLGLIVFLALILFVAGFSWLSWSSVRDAQASELRTVAEMGAQSADVYFSKLGSALQALDDRLDERGAIPDDAVAQRHFARLLAFNPELYNATLTRPDGVILFSALHSSSALLPRVTDASFFLSVAAHLHGHSQAGQNLEIGQPRKSILVNQWVIPLRYFSFNAAGALRHVISAQIPVGILQNFWKDTPIARRVVFGLIRDDGYVLSRYPSGSAETVDTLYARPRTGALITELREKGFPSSGYIEGASSIDPTMMLQSYKRLTHFPVTQFVTMPLSQVQAAWWSKVQMPCLMLGLMLALSGLAYGFFLHRQAAWVRERQRARELNNRLTYFDALTGLPNGRLLMERIELALAAAEKTEAVSALICLQVSNFQVINDARGYALGDDLLKAVARRLNLFIQPGDTVARNGRDEFVLLLATHAKALDAGQEHAQAQAHALMRALKQPIVIDGKSFSVILSIGVTLLPKPGVSAIDLLREADTAMYCAKLRERDQVEFFAAAMRAQVEDRALLEEDLADSIAARHVDLHLQPQMDQDGVPRGAELLMRWHHPLRGNIPPSHFIPLAEESGLIGQLLEWTLRRGCEIQLQLAQAAQSLPVSINISPRQFQQPDFVELVRAVLTETGADPKRLIFEVTEGMMIDNLEEAIHRMHQLTAWGLRFSLDDFGTGYSSLSYLKRLPLYELKIDKSFVREVPHDAHDTTIVRLIISMARELGLRVVAEGVETPQQAQFLIGEGCELLQGFLYARPMPVSDWLNRDRSEELASGPATAPAPMLPVLSSFTSTVAH